MKAIIYVSKTLVDFDSASINELANTSCDANREQEITGYLWYRDGYFLQYIEGLTDNLDKLYGKIKQDERHNIESCFVQKDIIKRRFPK